jgi:hypothetical protein
MLANARPFSCASFAVNGYHDFRAFDRSTGKPIPMLPGEMHGFAFDSNGTRALLVSGQIVKIVNLRTGKVETSHPFENCEINNVFFENGNRPKAILTRVDENLEQHSDEKWDILSNRSDWSVPSKKGFQTLVGATHQLMRAEFEDGTMKLTLVSSLDARPIGSRTIPQLRDYDEFLRIVPASSTNGQHLLYQKTCPILPREQWMKSGPFALLESLLDNLEDLFPAFRPRIEFHLVDLLKNVDFALNGLDLTDLLRYSEDFSPLQAAFHPGGFYEKKLAF